MRRDVGGLYLAVRAATSARAPVARPQGPPPEGHAWEGCIRIGASPTEDGATAKAGDPVSSTFVVVLNSS